MEDSTLLKKIEKLPAQVKKQAKSYVDYLYKRYVLDKDRTGKSEGKIADSDFFGIWKDRVEMKNSSKWVREVREDQWPRK